MVGVVVGSATLDFLRMWSVFGFGSLRRLFRVWMEVRLGSRFKAVTLVRVQRSRRLGFALVWLLRGPSLRPVLMSWLKMIGVCRLALGVSVKQWSNP